MSGGNAAGGDRGDDLVEVGVGGGEQVGAFAGAFVGQRRVAAGDQPFAGVVGMGDLGEVGLVEQGQLERPVVGGERGHRGGAQRGDPAEPAARARATRRSAHW